MERRGFLATLAGVFGAVVTGQAVKLSDLKALAEPVKEKLVSYRTYIVGNKALLDTQKVLFDKELIPNLKGESPFIAAASYDKSVIPGWASYKFTYRTSIPVKAGLNRQFFQYDTLGQDTRMRPGSIIEVEE